MERHRHKITGKGALPPLAHPGPPGAQPALWREKKRSTLDEALSLLKGIGKIPIDQASQALKPTILTLKVLTATETF